MSRWVERAAIVVVSIAVAIGVIALLSGGLAGSRDDPGVSIHTGPGPGQRFADQGDRHLRPGAPHPAYDSTPPTSGPHVPAAVRRDDARLSDDQLLQALEVGDVVFMYSTPRPPRGLQAVADSVAPRFTPDLAAHGETVILARRAGLPRITALAWTHRLSSDVAGELRAFAQYWLGRGAGTRTRSVVGSD
jgi:hypothetical protein